MFTFMEGRVAHLAQPLQIATQRADVPSGDFIWRRIEVLVTEGDEVRQDGVDLHLARDERGKGRAVV